MEKHDYNWNLILKISVPVSIIVVIIFFISDSKFLKWLFLIIGAGLAGFLAYRKDKKKANVFTSAAIIVLAAVIVTALKRFNIF